MSFSGFRRRGGPLYRSNRDPLDVERILKEIGLEVGNAFLDAGCGEGRFSIAASRIVGGSGKVFAIDISGEAISSLKEAINKKNITNIEAFTGDITERIPVEENSIDVCLMANILHGLVMNNKVESSLKQVYKVIKPGGLLGVVDFKKINGPPGPPLSIRISPEEVEETISKYGFKKRKVAEVGEYHYAITFVKTD